MLLLNNHGAVLVDKGVVDFYVEDSHYALLSQNQEAIDELLKKLNRTSVIINRLGREEVKGSEYVVADIETDVPVLVPRKVAGYNHKI